MSRPQYGLNVHGGFVQVVFASSPDLQMVVDDCDTAGLDSSALVDLSLDRRRCSAAVVEMPPVPLEVLAGSDVEQVVNAACDQEVLLP